MKKILSFFMALWFSLLSLFNIPFTPDDLNAVPGNEVTASEENIALFKTVFEAETKWLASLQLENGAIPMTYNKNGELRMSPYFADFAALALLDNPTEYAENVKKYMDWHFAHLNSAEEDFNGLDGTIYDYVITMKDGKIVDEKVSATDNADAYDSTDSYAATFLRVLNKYYEKTGDRNYILSHTEEICRITNVMFATLHNGLTFAKPNHKVKYLMDNCEVYEGALAAAALFENVICPADGSFEAFAAKCNDLARQVKDGINNKLWNFVGGYYTPEMTAHGIPTKIFSWKKYYPCATAQLFPIASGIIEPDTQRAKNLYSKFCESYNWQSFDYPDAFYWGANVYTAAVMNDLDSVVAYMTNYMPLLEGHKYPLYNADSARVSMAAYIMIERNTK